VVADRGYARVRDFDAVPGNRADFVTRLGWRLVRLRNTDGTPIDPLGELPCDGCPCDRVVHVAPPLHLIIAPLPAEQQSIEAVLSIYRQRWQIELAFKRLKSLGDTNGDKS